MITRRFTCILGIAFTLLSSSCSKLLSFGNDTRKESSDPIPVSLEYDGVFIEENQPDKTRAQFYLRKHSFSFYIRTYFAEKGISLKMLMSSGEQFELNKWYSLPSPKTDDIWESFAKIIYDRGFYPKEEDLPAVDGRVKFTKFEQAGNLSYSGECHCTIQGEFEITFENNKQPEKPIEINNGKFYVPKSHYWDSRAMED